MVNPEAIIWQENLRPADVIVFYSTKFWDVFYHYAVYLGEDPCGIPIIVASMNIGQPGARRICPEDMASLAENLELDRIRRFEGNEYDRAAAVERGFYALENFCDYHLYRNNCEHLANFVQYEKSYSQQSKVVRGIGIGAIVAIGAVGVSARLLRRK